MPGSKDSGAITNISVSCFVRALLADTLLHQPLRNSTPHYDTSRSSHTYLNITIRITAVWQGACLSPQSCLHCNMVINVYAQLCLFIININTMFTVLKGNRRRMPQQLGPTQAVQHSVNSTILGSDCIRQTGQHTCMTVVYDCEHVHSHHDRLTCCTAGAARACRVGWSTAKGIQRQPCPGLHCCLDVTCHAVCAPGLCGVGHNHYSPIASSCEDYMVPKPACTASIMSLLASAHSETAPATRAEHPTNSALKHKH